MRFLIPIAITLTLLSASDKEALLIGNSQYEYLDRLSSPSQDIPALASKLRDIGFEVVELYNQDEKSMKKAIKDFKKRLLKNPNAIALFYYSGHGSQAYGESYLIPIDGDTRDQADVEADGIKVETIAQKMATARTKANILFLDACRDVPVGKMGGTKGLGQVKRQPSSTLILYSTSKNRTANDDRVFNRVVLSKLGLNQPFSLVVNDISYTVGQKTGGSQVPELLSTGLPNIVLGKKDDMCTKMIVIPAKYKTIKKKVMIEKGTRSWRESLSSSAKIVDIPDLLSNPIFKKAEPGSCFVKVWISNQDKSLSSEEKGYIEFKWVSLYSKPKNMIEDTRVCLTVTPSKYKIISKKVLIAPVSEKNILVPCDR